MPRMDGELSDFAWPKHSQMSGNWIQKSEKKRGEEGVWVKWRAMQNKSMLNIPGQKRYGGGTMRIRADGSNPHRIHFGYEPKGGVSTNFVMMDSLKREKKGKQIVIHWSSPNYRICEWTCVVFWRPWYTWRCIILYELIIINNELHY